MRIIAGKYKNREILAPTGETTRPLLTRVRKSLFDILQPYLPGARILDLFSGTGAVAIEALSRGASYAISVEADRKTIQIARRNQARVCPGDAYHILQGDVLQTIPRLAIQEEPFDIIGVTPPYGKNLCNRTLELLEQHRSLLTDDTVIFIQRDNPETVDLDWPYLDHVRTKGYGRTVIEFFLPKLESKP